MPRSYTKEELENGRWITVNGAHIFLKDGETMDDAMKRVKAAMNQEDKKRMRGQRVKDADLDKMALNEFKQGVDAVLSDFGIENDIQFDYKDTDNMIAQSQEEDGDNVIYLTEHFKDYDGLYKTIKKNANNGVVTSLPIMFNGIHEAGHIIEQKLNPYGEHFTEMFSKEVVAKAQRQCRTQGKDGSRKSISEYATRDVHETVAEAITDYFHNGDNAKPLSIEIYNELKRRSKGGK